MQVNIPGGTKIQQLVVEKPDEEVLIYIRIGYNTEKSLVVVKAYEGGYGERVVILQTDDYEDATEAMLNCYNRCNGYNS